MSTRAPTMLTSAVLAHPRELIAAHSVNHQADGVMLDPHYDLSDEPPDGALARRRRRAGTVSDALDIRASASRRSRSSLVSGFCALPPTPPARLGAPAPRASARSSAAPVRPRPDGSCSRSSSFTLFFCILLTRSVRTCRASILQSKVSGLWLVRLLEDKHLLNIADGDE
jgi:hypothetical protein